MGSHQEYDHADEGDLALIERKFPNRFRRDLPDLTDEERKYMDHVNAWLRNPPKT